MDNLTKREICNTIYEKTKFPLKQVEDVVQLTLDSIQNALASGRNVELRNFGVFELAVRKGRVGRNPRKPEEIHQIPTRIAVKFKMGKILKAQVKKLDLKTVKPVSPQPSTNE